MRLPLQARMDHDHLSILVSDDQPDVLEAIRLLLKSAGHETTTANSPAKLLEVARSRPFDLILMDLNYSRDTTSGREGLDLLASLEAGRGEVPVVVMTAWSNVDLAVEAMQRGAVDFIQKPWDNSRLLSVIDRQTSAFRTKAVARHDLDRARDVQRRLLPKSAPGLDSLDCAALSVPAAEIGGDYYDFLDAGSGRVAFLLADVSGKGVAAGLLMAHLRASFHSQSAATLAEPAAAIRSVNNLFVESTALDEYATLFYGVYHEGRRQVRYVNCGHLAPVLIRSGGSIERLAPTTTVLGLFAGMALTEASVDLSPGDTLLLFSDGITEAANPAGDEFGENRLPALMRGALPSIPGRILDAVRVFSPGSPSDDRTVVCLRARC
ncbi:MAG: SpoIIE family protein phosphatase [Bryobacteraceae bacterium]|jgi:sigma-B regulation protein RsbU (phosphoserine phosphatase)